MHRTTVQVRYAETDQAGVVYHANYLPWFEVGRTRMLADLGISYSRFEKERGLYLTVAETHLRYVAPSRYDDVIEIETRVGEVKRVRLRLDHHLSRQANGQTVCTGWITLACITAEGRPVALPDDLADILRNEMRANED